MKENGFAIGLLIGTIVIGGALVFVGVSQGKRYADIQSNFSDSKADVERMANVRPFPTQENLEKRKTEVTAFRGKVEGLQNAIQAYRPETLETISPADFQNNLVSETEKFKKLFNDKGIDYPEPFAFGMESYTGTLPQKGATAELNYQLKASEWLFRQLAREGVYGITNVVREALPSETGVDWKKNYNEFEVPLAQSMPMEVTFLADEPIANEFINTLVTSKEYFFVVDMVRISNEHPTPPNRNESGLDEEDMAIEDKDDDEGFADGFGFGFGGEEEEGEAEAEAEGEAEEAAPVENEEAPVIEEGLILGQVLGKEGVYVALQIRLLLFGEPVELPEFN